MKFYSTRDIFQTKYSSAQIIKQGIADDGGLFVPEIIPQISAKELNSLPSLTYPELAANILSRFLTDYTYDELLEDCKNAYDKNSFPSGICPLHQVDENTFSLELWHGPTCAFKDMALQIMPRLLSRALRKTGENKTALVLVATSGDTGKAALEGYKDINQIKISVFYPENGVSTIQKLQMITQTGENVNVCGVNGNFDDIQTGVKQIFSNKKIASELYEKGYILSSANSINFGRLAPQIVYYFKAYCDLLSKEKIQLGENINVCVPTGNFGNILAAYIAKLMGLPINKLICASNSNNILTDFLSTGTYDRNRKFHLTMSPSMDILISSNLERLLYFVCGASKTKEYMLQLNKSGKYTVDSDVLSLIQDNFVGYYASEKDTALTIKNLHEKYGYLIDTHTAVAFSALQQYREKTKDLTPTVVASTANPYKFAKDVYNAVFDITDLTDIDAFHKLTEKSGESIPFPLQNLENRPIRFENIIDPDEMYNEITRFLSEN